jgi:glucose/mannose transport system permease protein
MSQLQGIQLKAIRRKSHNIAATIATLPFWAIVLFAYLGTIFWTVFISFTNSKTIPSLDLVGTAQYVRLFNSDKWNVSLMNLGKFGVVLLVGSLIIGFLLAIAMDQKIRGEDTFRTIILYPYAMSFIVTGLVWKWMMNPTLGLQRVLNDWGWTNFWFDWTGSEDWSIYAVALAGLWQGSGVTMAILLAGLRGVDTEIWKAARVDGIPTWRVYVSIVFPMMRPTIITAVVLMSLGILKSYDLVIALTNGLPGISSEVPAKFIIDFFFTRQNIAQAAAACAVLLIIVLVFFTPWFYFEYIREKRRDH